MVQKIEAWRSVDGQVHATQLEAAVHETEHELRSMGIENEVFIRLLLDRGTELLPLLVALNEAHIDAERRSRLAEDVSYANT